MNGQDGLERHVEWALNKKEVFEFWLKVLMTMLREGYQDEPHKNRMGKES